MIIIYFNSDVLLNKLYHDKTDIETTKHFFLQCQNFSHLRLTLLNSISNIDPDLKNINSKELTNLLLYGNSKFDSIVNNKVLSCSIQFILSSDRFSGKLF